MAQPAIRRPKSTMQHQPGVNFAFARCPCLPEQPAVGEGLHAEEERPVGRSRGVDPVTGPLPNQPVIVFVERRECVEPVEQE